MTDKETSEGKSKPRMHALHRHYNKEFPQSLRVDWEKLQGERMVSSHSVHERLELLMAECDTDLKEADKYNKGALIFIVLLFVGALFPLKGGIILWIGGLIGWAYLTYKGNKILDRVKRRTGFIDGIFFVLTEITADFERAEKQQEQKETTVADATIK